MKLLSRDQIEALSDFKCKDHLTTSFFLDTSKNRLTKKEIQLGFKNLTNTARFRLEKMPLGKSQKESLLSDLDKIKIHAGRILSGYNYVGLTIFSCSRGDFWRDFELVKSPRNQVVFDDNPYVRPLSAILEEYHRVCVLVLDRKEARWYDIYMGEIFQLDHMKGDVPSRTREGGWEGYSSKRIERHADSRLKDFLKQVSKRTYSLMKETRFEWLFIGCTDDNFQELESQLHSDLQKRYKSRLKAGLSTPPDRILKETLELKNRIKREEKEELVLRFIREVEKNGLAVSGLKNTLQNLNQGKLQTLLVTRHSSSPGRICPKCRFLFEDEGLCPSCQIKTQAVLDVIDEAVDKTLNSSGQVKHINAPTPLERFGGIGAFLRYKA